MIKRKCLKSSIALLLSSLIVTSGATVLTASAAEPSALQTEDKNSQSQMNAEVSKVSFQTQDESSIVKNSDLQNDDPKRTTGSLGFSEEAKKNIPVIHSVSEYRDMVAEDESTNQVEPSEPASNDLPSFVDNSQTKYFPAIGNQGGLGSCVAWSSIYYQMSYTVNKMLDRTSTWENTLSPIWAFNYGNAGDPYMGMLDEAPYKIAKSAGIATLRTAPNVSDGISWTTSEAAGIEAQKYKIASYEELAVGEKTIDGPDSESIRLIKTALANGDVLTAGTLALGFNECIIVPDSRVSANQKYSGQKIITALNRFYGGHRVAIVGYDDNIWYDINGDGEIQDAEKGAFKMANSWGESFGNEGFIWVCYDALNVKSALGTTADKVRIDFPVLGEFIRIDVQPVEKAASGINLEFDMISQSRYDNKVVITAVDANGKKYTHSVEPFQSQSAKDAPKIAIETPKTFVYDLNTVVPGITSDHLNDYQWSVSFKDFVNNNLSTTISNVKIVDTNHDIKYQCDVSSKKINYSTFNATINTDASNGVSLLGYTSDDWNAPIVLDYFHTSDIDNVLYTDQSLELSAKAKENGSTFSYRFGYIKDGKEVLGKYSSNITASFDIPTVTSIVPVVYVKDNKGNSIKKTGKTISVKEAFKIDNFESNAATLQLNDVYGVSFSVKNSVNSKAEKDLSCEILRNNVHISTLGNTVTDKFSESLFSPEEPGHYDVTFFINDVDGRQAVVKDSFDVAVEGDSCELYYSGLSDPTLYYSKDNGKTFQSVKMSKSTRFPSVSYSASLGAINGTAKVYFANSEGKDDNNGHYYTVTNGQYICCYRHIYTVSKNADKYTLKISRATLELSSDENYEKLGKIGKNHRIYIEASISKGISNFYFVEKGFILKDGTNIHQSTELSTGFATNLFSEMTINVTGVVKPYITITDLYGNTATKIFDEIEVYNTALKNFKATPSNVMVGKQIKFSWDVFRTSFEPGEIKQEQLTLKVTKGNKTYVNETLDFDGFTEYDWTPKESGTYTAKLTSTSKYGVDDEQTIQFTVKDDDTFKIASFTTTSPSQIVYPQHVKATAQISGGKAPYKYQFGYIKDGQTMYDRVQQSDQTSMSYDYIFSVVGGKYTPTVDVTDANGTTLHKELTPITVSDGMSLTKFEAIPASPVEVGTEITFNAAVKNAEMNAEGKYYSAVITIKKDNTKVSELNYNDANNKWTPTEAGTYTATIKVIDVNNVSVQKSITITVEKKQPVENQTVVYYKGYSSPYIHYQVAGGSWTEVPGVKMTETSEIDGYTHKYTINLGQAASATVCFNDGNGHWDSNNGSNYQFSKGTFGYSNGKIVEISKPEPDKLTVQASIVGGNSVPVNQNFTIAAAAAGGTAPYQYKYIYSIGNSETVIKDYSNLTSTSFKFETPNTYTVNVTVKDSKGETATSTITISALNVSISGIKADKTQIKVGDNVTFTASANTGRVPVTYQYTIVGNGVSQVLTTNKDNSASWSPTKEGTYTLSVSILYNGSTITTQTMSYTVEKADPVKDNEIIVYYKGYATPYIHYQVAGGNWTAVPGMKMTETSEIDGYTHKYTINLGQATSATVCFNDGNGNWDSNNGSNYQFNKGTFGYSNGKIVEISKPEPDQLTAKVSIEGGDYIPVNLPFTINTQAQGGTAPYQYKYTCKVNGAETVIRDFSTSTSVTYQPKSTDIHNVTVTVKDSTGKTVQSDVNVYMVNLGFSAFRASKEKVKTGESVTFTATADSFRIPVSYRFTISGNGISQTLTSTTGNATWTPNKEGVYTIKADILFNGLTAATRSMSYTVEKGNDITLNQIVIYYKGYSTPYIHYQVGSGAWTEVPGKPMTETSEMNGYTHKYIIDLGTQSYANVCFNDGHNNWDSRNGANYRFTKGRYTYSNGMISTVSNQSVFVVDPLVTNSTVSAERITLGQKITAKCESSGGKGECKYAFYYKKSSSNKWITKQDFSTNNQVTFKPAAATSYEVCIKAKDESGTIQKKYYTVKVIKPLEISAELSSADIHLGEKITAKISAAGGSENYTYAVFYKKCTSDKWSTAQSYKENDTVTFKPAAATTYDICVKVKDSDGKIAKQYFTVNVTK